MCELDIYPIINDNWFYKSVEYATTVTNTFEFKPLTYILLGLIMFTLIMLAHYVNNKLEGETKENGMQHIWEWKRMCKM